MDKAKIQTINFSITDDHNDTGARHCLFCGQRILTMEGLKKPCAHVMFVGTPDGMEYVHPALKDTVDDMDLHEMEDLPYPNTVLVRESMGTPQCFSEFFYALSSGIVGQVVAGTGIPE